MKLVRIGTRGSALALVQARAVKGALEGLSLGAECEIVTIRTTGDKKQRTPEAKPGDKKEWIFEIEQAVVSGEIDLAIHSGKDIPVEIDETTEVLPILPRESPGDVLVANQPVERFSDLPNGAVVGTSSLRRGSQLLSARPDLKVVPFGGNVPTRLKRLREERTVHAMVVAASGMKRLGLEGEVSELLEYDLLIPAMNQGTLVVQCLKEREELREIVSALCDREVFECWSAEREAIAVLEADCHSAVGVIAELEGAAISVRCRVLSQDGSQTLEERRKGARNGAKELGAEVARALLARGARDLLFEGSE